MSGRWVDISKEMMHYVLLGPEFQAPRLMEELDYRLRQARTALILKDLVQRTEFLRWVGSHITEHGPDLSWVTIRTESIVKALLSFPAKF